MASISSRIKEAMETNKIKQSDLVERTGISKGAISSYISGKYIPKQKNIFLIAKALNVDEGWLMGCDVPMNKKNTDTTAEDKMNELFSKMDADDQSETLRYVEFKLASDKYKAKGALLHA